MVDVIIKIKKKTFDGKIIITITFIKEQDTRT